MEEVREENKENEEYQSEIDMSLLDGGTSRAETSLSSSAERSMSQTPRVENEKAEVDENGLLNLSHLSLTHLTRKFRKDYERVKCLIIDGNDFHSFSQLDMFKSCNVIKAAENSFRKLSVLIAAAKQLEELHLSRNQINNVDKINKFYILRLLDLSMNPLGSVPPVELPFLKSLDLSSTDLTHLPNVQRCVNLKNFNVGGNRIQNIEMLLSHIPAGIEQLNLSNNLLEDMTQFSQFGGLLNLRSLFVDGNPCVSLTKSKFNYKYLLFCWCPHSLVMVDGEQLTETEKIKGEWLYTCGKARIMDSHEKLVEYLTEHVPWTPNLQVSRLIHEHCMKALKQRKIAQEEGFTDADLSSTPVSEPKIREEGRNLREKQVQRRSLEFESEERISSGKDPKGLDQPLRSRDGTEIRKPRISVSKCVPKNSQRMVSPPVKSKKPMFQPGFNDKNPPQLTRTNSDDSSTTVVLSSARERENDDSFGFTTPTAEANEKTFELSPQPTNETGMKENQNGPHVSEVSFLEIQESSSRPLTRTEENLMERVALLEQKMEQLITQNEQLAEINDGLSGNLELLEKRCWERDQFIETSLRSMIPTPQNVHVEMKENDMALLRWDIPFMNGIRINVNDRMCGIVSGKGNCARISDFDDPQRQKFTIQVIGPNGLIGKPSAEAKIVRK